MIPHGNPSSLSQQPYPPGYPEYARHQPRPHVQEDELKSATIQVERKTISMSLKENRRGRFLCISEENGGKRNWVIIPVSGLAELKKMIVEMEKADSEIPIKNQNGAA